MTVASRLGQAIAARIAEHRNSSSVVEVRAARIRIIAVDAAKVGITEGMSL